jgi:predicted Rdx family selenoprotein
MRKKRGGGGPEEKYTVSQQIKDINALTEAQKDKTDAIAAKRATEAEEKAVSSQQLANTMKNADVVAGWAGKWFDKATAWMGPVWRDFTPYLVLILIFLILTGVALTAPVSTRDPNSAERDGIFNQSKTLFQRIGDIIKGIIAKLNFSHYVTRFGRMINPLGGTLPTTPRPKLQYGRCDMKEWFELNGDGESGFCTRTYMPKDINWLMDTDKMSAEMKATSPDLVKQATNYGQKLQVNIPWEKEVSFFVPKCSQATFADGTSASHLFEDEGLTCKPREVSQDRFTNAYRSPTSESPYNFISINLERSS